MKFLTHNDKDINCGGTSLQGEIDASYRELVHAFGKPSEGDAYKTDAEWEIEFEDGTVATIYNYKDGKNYCGPNGLPKTKIRDWHVGGKDTNVVEKVLDSLKFRQREKKLTRITKK